MEIVSRKTALKNGISKYLTGRPCRRGHLTFRYAMTGVCTQCAAEYSKKYKSKGFKIHLVLTSKEDFGVVREYVKSINQAQELQGPG